MEFKQEVQQYFKIAGWYEGRDVRRRFNKVRQFDEFPDFLREFLYEYGDLVVETHKYRPDDVTAVLDLGVLSHGLLRTDSIRKPRYFGNNLFTFPFAYYPMDNAIISCDADGRVYFDCDFPGMLSADFITGIEMIIMEDYAGRLSWDPEAKAWVDDLAEDY